MVKGQKIYVTVYCTGCCSDYLEQVVGITDSKEQALGFAKQMADYVNSQDDWWFDNDTIVIREYKFNEFRINASKAYRNLWSMDPAEVTVYTSGKGSNSKIKPVEGK